MGCRSDYLDPTSFEIKLSNVFVLLDEIKTNKKPENYGSGQDPRVYSKNLTTSDLDNKTHELCEKLQGVDVSKYSLEMQLWWREHQKADAIRVNAEIKAIKNKKALEKALAKLTPYEKQLLNVN